jgi:tetratricopeptide (TPR) repeat protein
MRLPTTTLLILLLYLTAGGGVARTQDPDYPTAVSLVQAGQTDQALLLLQRILARSPNDLRARNLMGIALSSAGRREEANEQFKRILDLDPRFVPALKNLAVNELALGLTEPARLRFEEVLKLSPRDPAAHIGLAEIAFSSRRFETAIDHYQQSGDLPFKDPRVLLRFAGSYAELKQGLKTAAVLEKISVDVDPTIQFQAGLLLAKLEMFEAAAARFRLAQLRSKDPYQAGFNLVLMLMRSGNHDGAITTARSLLATEPRKAELYNLLSQAYEQSGKTKEAYDALRAATELEPKDETNYLDLVILCLEHSNYDLGLEIAEIGIRRIPQSHRLHLQRGALLAMKAQFEDAAKEFQISAELSPESPLSRVAMGFVLIQAEKIPEAIALLRSQAARSPQDPYVFWFLGEALNRSGLLPGSEAEKETIAVLETSIRLNARLPQPRALLGKIRLRRGEIDAAILLLEKAIELDPQDLTATYQLAQALQRKGNGVRARELLKKVERTNSGTRDDPWRKLFRIVREGSK